MPNVTSLDWQCCWSQQSFSSVQPVSVWNGHRAAMLTMTNRWEAPVATTQLSRAVMSGSLFHATFCCCELISSFVLSTCSPPSIKLSPHHPVLLASAIIWLLFKDLVHLLKALWQKIPTLSRHQIWCQILQDFFYKCLRGCKKTLQKQHEENHTSKTLKLKWQQKGTRVLEKRSQLCCHFRNFIIRGLILLLISHRRYSSATGMRII